ncbi:hypothetical protein K814_0118015 [Pseudomonas fluorescens LMG 5329]|jgi:hypothetical protein|uniref:Uncharacterized protein n=1 Tax=Pseudomonas fluorescens LMG 5329 TaxID=1324332 RepID=A0A0A1Z0Q3_PSEFL|nr:hypothetical protein K814_0118015 [Pseudomonas fluorescens LMG 5329]
MTAKGRVNSAFFLLLECWCVLGEDQYSLYQQFAQHDQLLAGQQLVAAGTFATQRETSPLTTVTSKNMEIPMPIDAPILDVTCCIA